MIQVPNRRYRQYCSALVGASLLLIGGCAMTDQLATDEQHKNYGFDGDELASAGVALMTPSGAAGQDSYKRNLAQAFAEELRRQYPQARVVELPETLSLVNHGGHAEQYKTLFSDYEKTGLLEGERLKTIAADCGVRYVAHLDLAKFNQSTNKRFSAAGFRLVDTKQAGIRMALELWDADTGAVAWQGSEELYYSYETARERPVTFSTVAAMASDRLVRRFDPTADSTETAPVARHWWWPFGSGAKPVAQTAASR